MSPSVRLSFALLLAGSMVAAMSLVAIKQPWLGVRLTWDPVAQGAVIERSVGPAAAVPIGVAIAEVVGADHAVRLSSTDLTVEPDGAIGSYAAYDEFLKRQDALARIQRASEITLVATDGARWTIRPAPERPLLDLPPAFWIQLLVGVTAWLVSAAVWSFRPGNPAAAYLMLSGLATLMFAQFAAPYSTRELALPAALFRAINDLNFLGGSLFAAALVGLLLCYPRKIAPGWIGKSVLAIFVGWYVAQQLGAFESMTFARRALVLLAIGFTFVLSAIHWRLTRRDPIARASLIWFLMSWVLGVTIFSAIIFIPQLLGADTSGLQPYAFLIFLLVYVGLAFGILRYRLFDLGAWWGRVIGWATGLIVLGLFDLAFAFGLGFSAERSLSLALLLCGLLWFPLRGWFGSRLADSKRIHDGRARFEQIVEAAFERQLAAQVAAWKRVMESVFAPLTLTPAPDQARATLEDNGLELVTPAIDGIPSFKLTHAAGGRRLFTRADLRRADELSEMLRFVLQSRGAYERGVAVERARIAGDLHDNLGASLLSALHSPDADRKDRLIRDTLADLRSIITEPMAAETDYTVALSDARREMAERLEAMGVDLKWESSLGRNTGIASAVFDDLRAMLREITNNIIKHAGAHQVTVSLTRAGGELYLEVSDDGVGFDPTSVSSGFGLSSLAARARRHGGTLEVARAESGSGTQIRITLRPGDAPLPWPRDVQSSSTQR